MHRARKSEEGSSDVLGDSNKEAQRHYECDPVLGYQTEGIKSAPTCAEFVSSLTHGKSESPLHLRENVEGRGGGEVHKEVGDLVEGLAAGLPLCTSRNAAMPFLSTTLFFFPSSLHFTNPLTHPKNKMHVAGAYVRCTKKKRDTGVEEGCGEEDARTEGPVDGVEGENKSWDLDGVGGPYAWLTRQQNINRVVYQSVMQLTLLR
ncbi:hypothetical protein EDC04DRAFT_2607533 [Pisolithus marmoratus]|nr:hypothetical protein EDC04DRAFT_2607533 [Pisolithus marmoratus]